MSEQDASYLRDKNLIFDRFDMIDKRFELVDKRFESIDKKFENVDKKFESIERRFDKLDEKIDAMNIRFEKHLTYCESRKCPAIQISQDIFNKQANAWFYQRIGLFVLSLLSTSVVGGFIVKLLFS